MQRSTAYYSSVQLFLRETVRISLILPALILVGSLLVAMISNDITFRGLSAISAILCLAYFCARRPLWGCAFIIFMTLILDDTTWQFSTITHDLGFYFYRNWWKLISPENIRRFDLLKI